MNRSLGLAFVCLILLVFFACKQPQMPPIDLTFWAGDSANGGVSRSQEGKTIPASDPSFDNLACLSYEDIRKIYSTLLQCRDWGSNRTMSQREIKMFYKRNADVIEQISNSDQ